MYIHSFYHQVHCLIENNRALRAMTLGLAIVGNALAYFAGKSVVWLRQCCGIARKTEDAARHVFNSAPAHQTALYLYDKQFKSAFDKTAPFKGSQIRNLADIYGTHTYRQSFQEIQDILDSQKIYLSASLPLPFYMGLKQAMKADQIVILPGQDDSPCLLADLDSFNYPSVSKFLHSVDAHYAHYGFASHQEFEELMKLSLYQLGSQVVKTEDYRIFIDGDGKIRERHPGEKDTVRLINACGIRGIKHHPRQKVNKALMTQTFKTCLQASENGFVLVPAVGMGVWRGNPDLYWRAMLDAVIASNDTFEGILVNPRHSVSSYGRYKGCSGEELQQILDEYLDTYKHDHAVLNKLRKVVNLYDTPKDIAQLAINLKQSYPHKTISLLNASDPDVTL